MKMFLHRFLFLVISRYLMLLASAAEDSTFLAEPHGRHEYCLKEENFEAKCLKNEVIVPVSAAYGRMRIGRCLEAEANLLLTTLGSDPLFIGCSVDVLYLLNRKCAGKNYCEIRGNYDIDLKKEKPCHAALQSYLEIDYSCVSVVEEDRSCSVTVSSNPLHIMHSSSSSSKLSCGTKSQPWRLEAPAGQQINVSLLDFSTTPRNSFHQEQIVGNCLQYGYITEKFANKNISICGATNNVGNHLILYKSSGNLIEIVFNANHRANDEENHLFLIRLAAVGCSDIVPPEDTWLRRNDNEAFVGCYSSRQTWHLRCDNNQWVGVIGNCTRVISEMTVQDESPTIARSNFSNQVLIIVAIGFLALIFCVIIICSAAVCLRRYYVSVARNYGRKIDEMEKYKYVTSQRPCQNPEGLLQT